MRISQTTPFWPSMLALVFLSCATETDVPAELDAALTTLERDVSRLEDSKAIKRLQRAYGYYLDKGMVDELLELYSGAADASVEIGGSGVYIGKERIADFYRENAGDPSPGELNDHMIMQGVVHIGLDGGSANGRWRGLILSGVHGESANWAEGPYENEYVKEDGVWKLHKVHWYATMMAPYDPGWVEDPQPLPGPSAENPPDQPPSLEYETYPSVYLPPYHYEHPVRSPWPEPLDPPSRPSSGLEDAWSRLAEVRARAARVADINAIENLQRTYGFLTDKMLWDDVAALFADDGTLEIGPSGVYVGRASVREYLYSLSDGVEGPIEGELYEHMQLQPIVTVAPDGSSADARWRGFMQIGTLGEGSGGQWGEGIYENQYVQEDGVWKISSLHFYPTFIAPYEGGWQNASAGLVAEYAMGPGVEPDRPSSGEYRAYPESFVAPFHYGTAVAAVPDPVVVPIRSEFEDLTAAIDEVRGEIGRLEDRDDIENIAGIYGFYVDMSMQDDIADLFNEEGIAEILGRGVFVGIDRVRQYMHNLGPVGPQPGRMFTHMHIQPVINVADDGMTANARARLFVMFGVPGNAQFGAGIYENEFIKEDGAWKIDYLHGYQTVYTPYQAGWARTPNPMMGLYPQLPPDRPQSVDYAPFPAAFVPPFHYPHPVTGEPLAE